MGGEGGGERNITVCQRNHAWPVCCVWETLSLLLPHSSSHPSPHHTCTTYLPPPLPLPTLPLTCSTLCLLLCLPLVLHCAGVQHCTRLPLPCCTCFLCPSPLQHGLCLALYLACALLPLPVARSSLPCLQHCTPSLCLVAVHAHTLQLFGFGCFVPLYMPLPSLWLQQAACMLCLGCFPSI